MSTSDEQWPASWMFTAHTGVGPFEVYAHLYVCLPMRLLGWKVSNVVFWGPTGVIEPLSYTNSYLQQSRTWKMGFSLSMGHGRILDFPPQQSPNGRRVRPSYPCSYKIARVANIDIVALSPHIREFTPLMTLSYAVM